MPRLPLPIPALAALVTLVSTPTLRAQTTVDTTGAGALIAQATDSSQVMETLQHLTDVIGPRLSGSPAMRKANDWVAERLRSYGLTARLEEYSFGVTWARGPAAFRITAPFTRAVTGHSWAWTAGTGGKTLAGPVVLADLSTPESLAVYKPRLKGAWVLSRPSFPIWNPDGPPMTAADPGSPRQPHRRYLCLRRLRAAPVRPRSAVPAAGRGGTGHPDRRQQGARAHDHERVAYPGGSVAERGDLA